MGHIYDESESVSPDEINAACGKELNAIADVLEGVANESDSELFVEALQTVIEVCRIQWDFTAPHRTRTSLLIGLGTLPKILPSLKIPSLFCPAYLFRATVACLDDHWMTLEATTDDTKHAISGLRIFAETIASLSVAYEETIKEGELPQEALPALIVAATALAKGLQALKGTNYPDGPSGDIAALAYGIVHIAENAIDE